MPFRFKATLVVALAALLGGGGAALAVALRREPAPVDRSPQLAAALAREADSALAGALTDVAGAGTLAALIEAGRAAERRTVSAEALNGKAGRIGHPRYRSAVLGVIAADVDALRTIALLAGARTPTSTSTRRFVADAGRAQSSLDRAVTAWPGARRTAPQLTGDVDRTARQLRRIERRLRTWRVHVVQVRRTRKARLGVLDSYAKSFRTHMRNYQKLRDETDAFIGKTDERGSTFDEAYDFLSDAIDGRSAIRRGIAALDAPPSVAGTHNGVLTAIDTAIEAMSDAYGGISDFQFSREDYDDYKDTPGWRSFARKSDSLVGRYARSMADWERGVVRARRAITAKPLPARPEV